MDTHDPGYWVNVGTAPASSAPPPSVPDAPSRTQQQTGQIVLLVMLTLFLFDTFLPWQRACVDVSGLGLHIAGCLSANAWSGTAAHIGQAAGVFAIVAILAVGLRLGRVDFGDTGELVTKGCVYGTAAAGGLKWILVIGKLASFGAWIGLLLLLAIAILESVDRLGLA
jgi:hypothetical protein